MPTDLPKILLVSELTLSFSQAGKSSNPTLFNLFSQYPPELLWQFTTDFSAEYTPPVAPFEDRITSSKTQYLTQFNNRLGITFNPWLNYLNFSLLDWLPIPELQKIKQFKPDLILICPITPWGLFVGNKLRKYFDCPFVIYFMDDWIAIQNQNLLSQKIQRTTRELLQKASGWLMISEQLQADLSSRYNVSPQYALVAHNPVEILNQELPSESAVRSEVFKIIYAGSIQVMHYDAVAAVAEAIFQMRQEGKKIELILYTAQFFWDSYQDSWQQWEVKYGGLIDYKELNKYLKAADLLLVATSFLPENSHAIRSSILTKMTDYMAAGRTILSCGPEYSACNIFLKQWDCGLVCETNQVSEIKVFLEHQIEQSQSNYNLAIKAFKVLMDNFEGKKVRSKLYNFLAAVNKNKRYQD